MPVEFKFGPRRQVEIGKPWDTWLNAWNPDKRRKFFAQVNNVMGFSARTFEISAPFLKKQSVIKILRWDNKKESQTFKTEIEILVTLQEDEKSNGWLTSLYEIGFMKLHKDLDINSSSVGTSTNGKRPWECLPFELRGDGMRFTLDEVEDYLNAFDNFLLHGWLPYLILQRRTEPNLLMVCDRSYTGQHHIRPVSIQDAYCICDQICDMLSVAHQHDIVYLDHKTWHYYWNPRRKQTYIIDWNVSRFLVNHDDRDQHIAEDIRLLSLHVFSHLICFRPAVDATGRRSDEIDSIETQSLELTENDLANLTRHERSSFDIEFVNKANSGTFQSIEEVKNEIQCLLLQHEEMKQ